MVFHRSIASHRQARSPSTPQQCGETCTDFNFKRTNLMQYAHKVTRDLLLVAVLAVCIFTKTEAQRPAAPSWRGILRHPPEWYGSEEAVRIADNVLLYQHANGGWGKNINMAQVLDEEERRKVVEETRVVDTTIDNGSTFTQMRFLALVHESTGHTRFSSGFLRGVDYLLDAQYDNGGWPQFYPIRKGYYEHITYNDGAMIGVMRLLRDIAGGQAPYDFVDRARRDSARAAIDRGLEVILETQIVVDGNLTAWCAQHDRETLLPAKARSYELPSISGGESVGVVRYLMAIENPDAAIIRSVKGAIAWFDRSKVTGVAMVRKEDASLRRGYDRVVVADENAPPLWGRFYQIETNRPIFVGRDGFIKFSLAEIEHERRIGYRYLGEYATTLLNEVFPAWQARIGKR